MSEQDQDVPPEPAHTLFVDLGPALEQLRNGLLRAFADRQADETKEDARNRYMSALSALATFVDGVLVERASADELMHLAAALHDLDSGVTRDFLKPSKTGGRPQSPTNIWLLRGQVCCALDVICCSGMKREEAAKHIQKNYPELKVLSDRKAKDLSSSILSWDDQFRRNRVKNDTAQGAYAGYLETRQELIDKFGAVELRQRADRQLAAASSEASRIRMAT